MKYTTTRRYNDKIVIHRDVSELVYARRDFRSDSRADTGIKMSSQVNQGRTRIAVSNTWSSPPTPSYFDLQKFEFMADE